MILCIPYIVKDSDIFNDNLQMIYIKYPEKSSNKLWIEFSYDNNSIDLLSFCMP